MSRAIILARSALGTLDFSFSVLNQRLAGSAHFLGKARKRLEFVGRLIGERRSVNKVFHKICGRLRPSATLPCGFGAPCLAATAFRAMETTARRLLPDLRTGTGPLNEDSASRLVLVPTGLSSARARRLEARTGSRPHRRPCPGPMPSCPHLREHRARSSEPSTPARGIRCPTRMREGIAAGRQPAAATSTTVAVQCGSGTGSPCSRRLAM